MADRKIRTNYIHMLSSLSTFCTRIGNISESLHNAATACGSALGQEDSGVQAICKDVQKIQQKYADLAMEAKKIQDALLEDLQLMDKEAQVWKEDSE